MLLKTSLVGRMWTSVPVALSRATKVESVVSSFELACVLPELAGMTWLALVPQAASNAEAAATAKRRAWNIRNLHHPEEIEVEGCPYCCLPPLNLSRSSEFSCASPHLPHSWVQVPHSVSERVPAPSPRRRAR